MDQIGREGGDQRVELIMVVQTVQRKGPAEEMLASDLLQGVHRIAQIETFQVEHHLALQTALQVGLEQWSASEQDGEAGMGVNLHHCFRRRRIALLEEPEAELRQPLAEGETGAHPTWCGRGLGRRAVDAQIAPAQLVFAKFPLTEDAPAWRKAKSAADIR